MAADRRAMAVAGHAGDEAIARRGLVSEDAGVVGSALGALGRMGRLTDADLGAALADGRPVVRRRAVQVAVGAPFAVPLGFLLDDPDPTVVEVAAWACGEQHPPEPGAVERLGALAAEHEEALVREAAVAALGAIGDPAGLRAILAATSDRATVRRRAVLALAPFSGPEVNQALARARTDRDWQVRQAAEDLS